MLFTNFLITVNYMIHSLMPKNYMVGVTYVHHTCSVLTWFFWSTCFSSSIFFPVV